MKTNLISILWGGLLCLMLLAGCATNPQITMTTGNDAKIRISIAGIGTATIDWGDGNELNYTLNDEGIDVEYSYANAASYIITITGKNITGLNCGGNRLTSLDVSKNTALTWLDCGGNQLTSLDVSKNTALTELHCHDNQLTSLDVSKNTALTSLICGKYNKQGLLTSLDVSKNTALTTLGCGANQLTSLDVSKNTALTTLDCGANQLTSLDVSSNTALTTLGCGGNQLTSLNVSKNTALRELDCGYNQLTATALNALFGTLHSNTIGSFTKSIYIRGNPGTGTCNPSVAIAKGWVGYKNY